jgi:hypothetical protein
VEALAALTAFPSVTRLDALAAARDDETRRGTPKSQKKEGV